MSRNIPSGVMNELEASNARGAVLTFLTIRHRNLTAPIRVVSDKKRYVLGGETFTGVPFEFKLLKDSEGAPTTEIRLQNIDRRIGEAIRRAAGRLKVDCSVFYSAEFDLSQDPRVPLGEPADLFPFVGFEISDVTVTPTDISGTVSLYDYSTIPWPGVRATQSRCPGLFR